MMKKREQMNSYLRVREAQSRNAGRPRRYSDANRRDELTSYHTYRYRDTYGEGEGREEYGRARMDERYDNRRESDLLTTKQTINRRAVLLNIVTLIMLILIAVMTVYNVSLTKKQYADVKKSSDKHQIINEEVLNKSENGDLIPPIEPIK